MRKRFIDYQEELFKSLQDPEEAVAYLNAALRDSDERVFLLALKDVLEAQADNITSLTRITKLNRKNLYCILSNKGNPKLISIRSFLNAIGLELAVQTLNIS